MHARHERRRPKSEAVEAITFVYVARTGAWCIQLAEAVGFTGFLQHHWQDRYHPMKLTLYVALLWAVWHVPDHFAEEGWGVEALI